MKKISVAIIAFLMLCVVTLGGCAKADTATLLDCYKLYQNTITKYSTEDKYLFVDN